MSDFIVRRWDVSVPGYGTGTQIATTRGKALAGAWRSDAFCGVTFGDFIRAARARLSRHFPPRWGSPIEVLGKPAYFLGCDGQYVHFVRPNEDVVLCSHPLDVLPQSFRPRAYQSQGEQS